MVKGYSARGALSSVQDFPLFAKTVQLFDRREQPSTWGHGEPYNRAECIRGEAKVAKYL